MMASLSVADLEASAGYQHFKNRFAESAAVQHSQQPKAQEAMPNLQEQLKKPVNC